VLHPKRRHSSQQMWMFIQQFHGAKSLDRLRKLTGFNYQDVLRNWLMSQGTQHYNTFIFWQDEVLPLSHQEFRNRTLPNGGTGRVNEVSSLVTGCHSHAFVLWGYVKGKVFLPWLLLNADYCGFQHNWQETVSNSMGWARLQIRHLSGHDCNSVLSVDGVCETSRVCHSSSTSYNRITVIPWCNKSKKGVLIIYGHSVQ
jgi:heme-degrading monooxygenase HmoA